MQFRIATLVQFTALAASLLTIYRLTRGGGGGLWALLALIALMSVPLLIAIAVGSPAKEQTLDTPRWARWSLIAVPVLIVVVPLILISLAFGGWF